MSQTEPTAEALLPQLARGAAERAAFLHERAAPPPHAPAEPGARAEAEERARQWQQAMRADDVRFAERLALAGLSRDALVRLLAAAPREDAVRADAHEARRAQETLAALRAGRFAGEALPPTGRDAPLPFRGFLRPFLQLGAARLRTGVEEIRSRRGLAEPPAGRGVQGELLRGLEARVAPLCIPTLTLELNVARVLGQLEGETPEARFRFFSEDYLTRPPVLEALLEEYAVLGRLLVVTVERWARAALEFLDRLEEDRPLLAGDFGGGAPLGALLSARMGGSDPHREGRTVVQARFACGVALVYKPTSLAVDERFAEFLERVNALGLRHPHRPLRVRDRGRYGWLEFVAAAPCADAGALRRFYRRQGSHLALLHLLRAADFHFENLIAAGEHPVLIDLEALFHHQPPEAGGDTAFDETQRMLGRSVLASALLPMLTRGRDGRIGADISGLGGHEGQTFAADALDLAAPNTDRMHVVAAPALTRAAHNRPVLDGAAADPGAFTEEIASGFAETYDLLAAHRDTVAGWLDRFAGVEVRHLLRMTQHYGLFVREGSHPDALRDALEREAVLDRLWAEATVRPSLRRTVAAEVEDLRLGDVPVFAARPGERHLWDSRGGCIPEFFPRSALDEARALLAEMTPAERDRQARLIRLAIASVAPGAPPAPPAPCDSPDPDGELLAGAERLGEHLLATAVHGADDATWVTLLMEPDLDDPQRPRRVLAPAHPHLYDGRAGIALFLAYLGRETGRDDFAGLARRTLAGVRADLRTPGAPGADMAGVFVGWGSYLYLLTHLAALWDDPALLDEARAALPETARRVAADRNLDLLAGAAGCAVAALHLHRATGDPGALRLAARCGEHLLATAQPMPGGGLGWAGVSVSEPLSGFSHGAAGIAWALLELAAATGDGRFRQAAGEAVAWERRCFDPADGRPNHARLTWCHGAASIALGRVLCARTAPDPAAEGEIRRGMRALLAQGPMSDPCLCHGTLGNADLLLTAARAGGDPAWAAEARRWGVAVARQTAALERPGALPPFARSPGLMCGLAGVGLGLLRLRRPEAVPSVPALDPPPAWPAGGRPAPL